MLTDTENAEYVAVNCRNKIEALMLPHERSNIASYVTASIGVCVMLPTSNGTPMQMIERADQALYKSKSDGRNRITLADNTPHFGHGVVNSKVTNRS